MILQRITFLVYLMVGCISAGAQDLNKLQQELDRAEHDTARVRILVEMTEILYSTNPDTVIPICRKAIKIIDSGLPSANEKETTSFLQTKAAALNNIGAILNHHGKITEGLSYYKESFQIREKLNDKLGMSTTLNNIGATYNNLGDIALAIEHYHKSLRLQEEINDQRGVAYSLNNIGYIYKKQGYNSKAISYYLKSLKIREVLNDKKGMAVSLNNIGAIYKAEGKNDTALAYYQRSLDISQSSGYKVGMALSLNNIGTIHYNLKALDAAYSSFEKSYEIWEQLSDKEGMAYSLNYLASVSILKNDVVSAEKAATRSLKLAQEIGFPENIRNACETLSEIYTKTGNWEGAFRMQVLFKAMSDSINNENIRKASIQKELKYAYEKKAVADSLKAAEERNIFAVRMKQQKTQRNALYMGIGLIGIFSVFIYNRFRVTRKQKSIIEFQKEEVEKQRELADSRRIIAEEQKQVIQEKQKEIIDSINYASRIQQAMLTSENYFDAHLKAEYFIYYQPKDIVSGDFYWAIDLNNRFYIATCDCTGHGVPGAFMSLLNISFLNENIFEKKITDPALILDQQRNQIIRALNPGGNENSKDGMDAVLCAFDLMNMKLEFSAANNPLWLVRDEQMIEYKPDKMPVGKGEIKEKGFTLQTVDLKKGDIIYTFTDGFADQFGGPRGKKFMYRQFANTLLQNNKLPMSEQKEKLMQTFKEWKGSHEQVDDVLVVGVKV